MIPGCPAPREPTPPQIPLPPGACDTHAHVFGPATQFPNAEERSYTPPDAPLEKYLGTLDTLGFARGALVQASAHGRDNSPMLDALARHPDRLRGVAVADADTLAAELRRWATLGVRGLRFNHFFRDGQLHYRGGVPLTAAQELAPTMRGLGWNMQLWIDVKDLLETVPALQSLALPVAVDHMGRSGARAGTETPGFQSLLRLLGQGGCWVKLSGAHRISRNAPDYVEAPIPRSAGARQPRPSGVGHRLAASSYRRRDAGRRPSARPVPAMDPRCGDPPPHPRFQSGAALRLCAATNVGWAKRREAARAHVRRRGYTCARRTLRARLCAPYELQTSALETTAKRNRMIAIATIHLMLT
jgi:predicted TIM-barrel fold metal-dependent hydrolase